MGVMKKAGSPRPVIRMALTVAVVLLLAAVVFTCISCGGQSEESDTGDDVVEEDADDLNVDTVVDEYVEQMDEDINSVNPDDFSESQLDDSALGI